MRARGFKGEYKGIGYKGRMRKKDEKERAKSSMGRALKYTPRHVHALLIMRCTFPIGSLLS
jgi:hypothetical protein